MADTTPSLALPLIAGGQAQKHVTHNEALALLDALVQLAVIDKDLSAPPAHPAEGDRYLIAAAAPGGAWTGWSGRIARYQDGAWLSLAPRPGWLAFVADEAEIYAYAGGAWVPIQATLSALQGLVRLGVGTTADAENPFAAKLNKALWTALTAGEGGTGDLRYTLNKQATGNVLSLLMQSGFSGRAEIGLVGGDDLSLRVSPDGGSWSTVFTVDRATGAAAFERGVVRTAVSVITETGVWTKPNWAREVTIILVGGGGGGGSGRRGAAGSVRSGGGAGGAGGLTVDTFPASELPATLTVEIGAGGAGGPGANADNANGAAGAGGGETLVRVAGSAIFRAYGGLGGGAGGTGSASGGAAGNTYSFDSPNGSGAASSATGGQGNSGANGMRGASGGGSGGGLSAANAASGGGLGGFAYVIGVTRGTGRGPAAAAGAPGSAGLPKTWQRGFGSGGGGGGAGDAAGTNPGGPGGEGGVPGGGAGGGGAAANGAPSGTGGVGGRGEAWIIARG